MLSQKILQTLFRALDLAEEVRAMVARMRGKNVAPPPWDAPPAWPPPGNNDIKQERAQQETAGAYRARSTPPRPAVQADEAAATTRPARKSKLPTKAAPKKKAAARKKASGDGAGTGVAAAANLAAVLAAVERGEIKPLTESMEVHGRNLLARMVWALAASEKTLGKGLTGPDVAALISQAGIKTVPNNVMRAVRQDGGSLFTRAPGEGRAVILTLTDEGKAQARTLGLLD